MREHTSSARASSAITESPDGVLMHHLTTPPECVAVPTCAALMPWNPPSTPAPSLSLAHTHQLTPTLHTLTHPPPPHTHTHAPLIHPSHPPRHGTHSGRLNLYGVPIVSPLFSIDAASPLLLGGHAGAPLAPGNAHTEIDLKMVFPCVEQSHFCHDPSGNHRRRSLLGEVRQQVPEALVGEEVSAPRDKAVTRKP